jgi:hypothetical protein
VSDERIVLQASTRPYTFAFVGSVVLTAIGVAMILTGAVALVVVGAVVVAFFGVVGLPALLIGLRRGPPRVEITPAGFTIVRRGRSWTYPWTAVTGVRVVPIGMTRLVGYGLDASFPGQESLRAASRQLSGVDGTLPPGLGRAEQVAALFESYRARYGRPVA